MLPNEIWGIIFEYDPTYKHLFHRCIDEIPDIHLAKSHKYIYETMFIRNINRISFHLDTLSGTVPYISLIIQDFTYFGNFNILQYINTDNNDRFIYNNSNVYEARKDGIDTRLRRWEWWINLIYNNTTTTISCSYHQIHGIMLEILFQETQTTMSKQITENEAIHLGRIVKQELVEENDNQQFTVNYSDFNNGIRNIPNAIIRTFDFSSYAHY